VNNDGSNKWMTDRDSAYQEYLVFKPQANLKEVAKLLDDMVIENKK
jgi:hypothetical protein